MNPGDPQGLVIDETEPRFSPPPPSIMPSAWAGWPADWYPPTWGKVNDLADTAWACVDLNARILASMPPYLVDAAPTIDAGWLTNPDPEIYSSWDEFAKAAVLGLAAGGGLRRRHRLLLDRLAGAFSRGAAVDGERGAGRAVSAPTRSAACRLSPKQILHLRYQSSVDDAHGHGPLEAGRATFVNAQVL